MAGSKSLGTLTLDLVARTAGFAAGLSKAERDSKKWKKSVENNVKGAGVAVSAAAVAVAGGIALIVNSQKDLIEQQLDTANSLDTTYTSLSNLERAGDLAGVGYEQIIKASQKLQVNIGKAIQGSDAQVEAFERLGLSAQELYDLPLDQRIAAINTALEKNVQASERAAVAAEIYGAKNGAAMKLLDAGAIAEASKQVELFGLNLSDIDASKVDAAADAMGVFSMGLSGAAKQLTVALAPALQAASEMFLQAVEDAGGLGTVVEDSVDTAINAVSFLMNAIDGVRRTTVIAMAYISGSISKTTGDWREYTLAVGQAMDAIPFVDNSKEVEANRVRLEESRKDQEEQINIIKLALEEPLAGDNFKKFWDDAKVASQEAAEQAVKTRAETEKTGEAFDDEAEARDKAAKKAADAAQKAAEAIEGEITALERAAKVWGMSAEDVKIYDLSVQGASESQLNHARALLDTVAGLEAQKKATEEYQKVAEGLRTDEERRVQTLRDQLAAIEAVNDASGGDKEKTKQKAIDAAFGENKAPDMSGVGEIASGPFSDVFKVNEKQDELEEWYATQMSMLDTFRQERSDLTEEWDAKELELKKQHEDSMHQLESARWNAALTGVSTLLGDLSGMMEADSKKGKERAKKMAIAQATINAYTAFTGALASAASIPVLGWVMAPIAAAAALAAGMRQVSAIKGQAHDGIMSVPSSGTWNLEKGERVTTANTSAKLDATLERVQNSMNNGASSRGGAKSMTVNQTINTTGAIDGRTSNQISMDTSRKQRIAMSRFG